MWTFTKTSKDIGFTIYYRNIDSINSVMGDDGYAQGLVSSIINKELVGPDLEKYRNSTVTPDWKKMELNIQKKYGAYYADRLVTIARMNWEGDKKNWVEWGKFYVKYVDKYVMSSKKSGHWFAFSLNNSAWAIFKYSKNKSELKAALAWSGRAVLMDPQPNWMDTYANLLYKLGNKDEAIIWQKIAVKLDPNEKDFEANLNKMQTDKPTWPQ